MEGGGPSASPGSSRSWGQAAHTTHDELAGAVVEGAWWSSARSGESGRHSARAAGVEGGAPGWPSNSLPASRGRVVPAAARSRQPGRVAAEARLGCPGPPTLPSHAWCGRSPGLGCLGLALAAPNPPRRRPPKASPTPPPRRPPPPRRQRRRPPNRSPKRSRRPSIQYLKTLASDEFEGRAPATSASDRPWPISRRSSSAAGSATRQRRQLFPDRADDRDHRRSRTTLAIDVKGSRTPEVRQRW